MNDDNVIQFPRKAKVKPTTVPRRKDHSPRWKDSWPRPGRMYRPERAFNPAALATFDISGNRPQRERQAIAAVVVKALLENHKVSLGLSHQSPCGIYEAEPADPDWPRYLSNLMLQRVVNRHITFIRNGQRVGSPPWLPAMLREAVYEFHRREE
jgi:hypothetical protein